MPLLESHESHPLQRKEPSGHTATIEQLPWQTLDVTNQICTLCGLHPLTLSSNSNYDPTCLADVTNCAVRSSETNRQLQCDQILPLSVKTVACDTESPLLSSHTSTHPHPPSSPIPLRGKGYRAKTTVLLHPQNTESFVATSEPGCTRTLAISSKPTPLAVSCHPPVCGVTVRETFPSTLVPGEMPTCTGSSASFLR